MFLFGLAGYGLALWFVPWLNPWLPLALVSLVCGRFARTPGQSLKLATAAGLSWAALARIEDMANADLVSQRLAGLLSLPGPWLTLPLFGLIIALSALLLAQFSRAWRRGP